MLTSAIRRVFIGALATGSVAVIAAASGAIANQNSSGVATFRPIQGISFQLGSKRAVGYFEPRNGKCLVTLMIAEKVDPDQAGLLRRRVSRSQCCRAKAPRSRAKRGPRCSSLAPPPPRPSQIGAGYAYFPYNARASLG
jgi:hypothetical protein